MAELSTKRRPDSTRRLALRVAQLCGAIRDVLNARRVSVLVYDPSAGTVSPYVSDHPDDERLRELGRKWSRMALEDFPAAQVVLVEQRPIEIEDAQRDDRLPAGLAADFGITSVHLEPLLADGPVGVLAIEPASAADSDDLHSIVPLVATSVGRVPRAAEPEVAVSGTEADFLLGLLEAAAAEPSLSRVLATVCDRVMQRVGARRAAVFLRENGHLVPRVARLADGSTDEEAWERFRDATAPLPLADEVIESGQPTIAEESSSPLIAGWWAESFDLESVAGVPIGKAPDVIGVLALETPAARRLSEEDVRLCAEAAGRVAALVERAHEMEVRTSHLQAATAIRRLLEEGTRALSLDQAAETLARVTKDALDVEHASVFLADADDRIEYVGLDVPGQFEAIARERLVGMPARDFRLWRRATRQPRPIFVEDARSSQLIPSELVALLRLRSYVAFALLSTERPFGLVVCSETGENRRWTNDERRLVSQLALEGSLVVENAALRATDRERIDELARQAFHDPLTDLPNRALFADRLDHALARLGRTDQSVAVLLLDLDGFKQINDSFGHEAGDQLLIAVSQRLRGCLRPADTVARLGGDEFTILVEEITELREATRVAERIEDALRAPFMLEGHEASITTSIGIAFSKADHADPDELIRNADAAMYKAKRAGKARYEVFEIGDNPAGLIDLEDSELQIKRSSIRGSRPPGDPGREGEGPSPLADRAD
jgi:diguanylate cyclase (GGDEF)-like protein